jgi:hypothetical protein
LSLGFKEPEFFKLPEGKIAVPEIKHRIFNKKEYMYLNSFVSKNTAEVRKKTLNKKGFYARITEGKQLSGNYKGRTVYRLWGRSKTEREDIEGSIVKDEKGKSVFIDEKDPISNYINKVLERRFLYKDVSFAKGFVSKDDIAILTKFEDLDESWKKTFRELKPVKVSKVKIKNAKKSTVKLFGENKPTHNKEYILLAIDLFGVNNFYYVEKFYLLVAKKRNVLFVISPKF